MASERHIRAVKNLSLWLHQSLPSQAASLWMKPHLAPATSFSFQPHTNRTIREWNTKQLKKI